MENMALKYSTEITQDNIDKITKSSFYQKMIDNMNSNKVISSLIKIQNSNIQINDNGLVLDYKIIPSEKYDLLSSLIKNYIKSALAWERFFPILTILNKRSFNGKKG